MSKAAKKNAKDELAENAEFKRLKEVVKEGQEKKSDWRKEARRAYNFIANRQWSDDDLALLAEQNRPAVSFNRCAPIIQAVCGLEINNRQAVAYLPREEGDVGISETITDLAKFIRDGCNAEDEDSEAFRDAVICGEGWSETRIEYDTDPQGTIIQERIDPLEMGTNKAASKASYEDARVIYRIRDMEADDAKDLIGGGYSTHAIHAGWVEGVMGKPQDGGEGDKRDYPDETRAGVEHAGAERKLVRVVQVQWWELEEVVLVAEEGNDELQRFTPDEFKKLEERRAMMEAADAEAAAAHAEQEEANVMASAEFGEEYMPAPPPPPTAPQYTADKSKQRVYYEAFLGTGIMGKKKLDMPCFQFKAITGIRDNEKKVFFGLMRDLFDPQMWANKWLSQTMNILNSNAKGGIIAETDAFIDQRKAESDWADPTKIIFVKPGSISKNKIKDRTPPQLPQGMNELIQFALSSMRDVTGVNLELMGQADREQAASLEAQRRQSAMTILAALFNSLRRYRKNQGKLMLYFIWLLPDGVLYRVTSEGKHKYVRFVKDKSVDKYDVIIDETPTSPDQKHMVWAITSQMLQQGLQFPPAVLVKLLKYSPYPETVVNEIAEAFGLGNDMPPEQMKQKLQQAEQALKVMEQQLTEAIKKADTEQEKINLERQRNDVEEYRAETERMKIELESKDNESDRQIDGAKVAIDAQDKEKDRQLEGARVATEAQDAAEERELTKMQAQLDMILQLLQHQTAEKQAAEQQAESAEQGA